MNWKSILIPVFALGILIVVIFTAKNNTKQNTEKSPSPTPTISTPQVLPTENQHADWKTVTDSVQRVTFSYPETLQTTYLHPQTWPPKITVSSDSYSCKTGGQIPGQPVVVQKTIDNTTYCIENMSQGAAGTIYSDYTYSFVKNNKLIQLQFAIAYPQCGNFPEPAKTACEKERQTFDLDSLMHQIAQTVQLESKNTESQPIIASPKPNGKISSPVTVTGSVPPGWMFEGVFPVKLLDAQRRVIVQAQAKEVTAGSWTSGKNVEFSATISFSTSAASGFLVLEKDNPSGLPENAASFEIPVTF